MEKQYRKGITLIEALFVLGIMAIIIGLVMVLYSQNSERNKENAFFGNELSSLVSAASALCDDNMNSSSCTTDLTEAFIKSGLIPNKYIKGNSSIIDPWGDAISTIVIGSMEEGSFVSTGNLGGVRALVLQINLHNPAECERSITAGYFTQAFGSPSVMRAHCGSYSYPYTLFFGVELQ